MARSKLGSKSNTNSKAHLSKADRKTKKPASTKSVSAQGLEDDKSAGTSSKNGVRRPKRKLEDKQAVGKPAKKQKFSNENGKDKSTAKSKEVVFRKKFNENYDNVQTLKTLWEELRMHKLESEKRDKLCQDMMKVLKGHVKHYLFAHDSSRVVQSLFKYASTEMKETLFSEMKDEVLSVMKSRYAKYLIKKIIKYGSKPQKTHVLNALQGNVTKLMKHSYAADVVDYLYSEYCNATQRTALVSEFFGPGFTLFKAAEPKTLEQVLADQPLQKQTILRDMKSALSTMTDKSVIQLSLVHKLFLEYFTNATDSDKTECLESLRDVLLHLVHTRDGAAVARAALWHGTAKDRKAMVRSFKGNVLKTCCDENGHTVLMAVFDCVDDTTLVGNLILKEMKAEVTSLAQSTCGRRVLLYLLHRRDSRYCTPALTRLLEPGDTNPNSKKPADTRAAELLRAVSPWLLSHVASNADKMFEDSPQLVLMTAVLCYATSGDVRAAMAAVARLYVEPFVPLEHPVERSPTQLALKQLLTTDAGRATEDVKFAEILLEQLPEGELQKWCGCNRGCFVCFHLLETKLEAVTKRVRKEVLPEKSAIESSKMKGAELLLSKL